MSLHRQGRVGQTRLRMGRISRGRLGDAPEAPAISDRFFGQVEIIPIASGQWRIRDSRIPSDDARSLLGFVEYTGETFDVLAVCTPRERVSVAEFREAVAELASHAPPDRLQPDQDE